MKYIFVVLGATSDLAVEKLFPAIFALSQKKNITDFTVVGVSRRSWSHEEFRTFVAEKSGKKIGGSKNDAARFLSRLYYKTVFFDTCAGIDELRAYLKELEGPDVVFLFYVSLSPSLYPSVFSCMHKNKLMDVGESRLLIEKPFGLDRESAQTLNKKLLQFLNHNQIYRIDHYLGKTALRMIMNVHEKTPTLKHLLSAKTISSIRVRFFEAHGIKDRGASYDAMGTLRDVGQNHMLEILAILCVAHPKTEGAIAWHDARADIIESLLPVGAKGTKLLRGQYRGYKEELNIPKSSKTETAFKFETLFGTGELKGVKVILEAGKKMPSAEVYAEIIFKENDMNLKKMTLHVQPHSQVDFEFMNGEKETISFSHDGDAYEHVLSAALSGRRDLFVGEKEILAAWNIVDPIARSKGTIKIYDEAHPFLLD